MIAISQDVYFFFDDSGVLHKNEKSGYFVYAGYAFSNKDELNDARRKYIHANKKLKKSLGRNDELKAAKLDPKHRRSLFNSVKKYNSVAGVVYISRIYDHILANKKSICRYKDYVLKRCIKSHLQKLISNGTIYKDEDIAIHIYIDEQLTATNGYYDLRESIWEELQFGIANFDYGKKYPPLFDSEVTVMIEYCDSSRNYMIQASDILANRIWTSFRKNDPTLREISNLTILTFP